MKEYLLQTTEEKIQGFLDLEENWDSYGGAKIDTFCATFIEALAKATENPPTPVPTSEGGVALEWHNGAEFTVSIKPLREHIKQISIYFYDGNYFEFEYTSPEILFGGK